MDLDALFEDLEAQAYFYPATGPSLEGSAAKLALVVRGAPHQNNLVLSSPLLGKDFIAGFIGRSTPCWIVLPAQSFMRIELLDKGCFLSNTELSLAELVARKLCDLTLKIQTKIGEITKAQILSVAGSIFEVLSAGKISYLANSALDALVVENLSSLQKLSGT